MMMNQQQQQPKDNTRMLPSISNLLISLPSDPPTLNLSPASPVLSFSLPPSTPPYNNNKSPTNYLSLDRTISPILSPIGSPSSSPYIGHMQYLSLNNQLPPLQGDDPPQRLRLPSPVSPISPKSLFSTSTSSSSSSSNWNSNSFSYPKNHSPSPSYSSTSSCYSFIEDVSCASIESSPSLPTLDNFSQEPQPQRVQPSTRETAPPIPNTQIVFDSSGQPVLKRRRGRPPTFNNLEEGGWTFLTPTVWDIHVSEEQKERELKADYDLSVLKAKHQQHPHQLNLLEDMNESMNAFTNSNMDTILQMPRKKRGRKPKTHIAGNSCFVWKDLTSTRSSSTIKK